MLAAGSHAARVIPPNLRVKQLKRLALLCGLPVTGRKSELISRLTATANDNTAPRPELDTKPVVLSIDLGIKNLAFSLLTPASHGPSSESKTLDDTGRLPTSSLSSPPAIKLYAWQRLSLLPNLDNQGNDEAALNVNKPAEVFAPAALAETANKFIKERVLQLNPLPKYILIERQRWRSGRAAPVQEWTVRVNTLEAMLHASLRTMRDVGIWKGDVLSIRPERVSQFFLEADPANVTRKKKGRKKSSETKKAKIELLNHWLGRGDRIVQPGNMEAGQIIDGYRQAQNGNKPCKIMDEDGNGNGIAEGPPTLGKKLDDFTDSLLQGMAWLRWRENMALLQAEGGVERLLGKEKKKERKKERRGRRSLLIWAKQLV